jgi:hypothetical protein
MQPECGAETHEPRNDDQLVEVAAEGDDGVSAQRPHCERNTGQVGKPLAGGRTRPTGGRPSD